MIGLLYVLGQMLPIFIFGFVALAAVLFVSTAYRYYMYSRIIVPILNLFNKKYLK